MTTATTAGGAVAAHGGSSVAASIGSMLVSLAFVLALVFLLAWVLRRVAGLRSTASAAPLRILASASLGGRERVVVIAAGETQLVLGVTAQQVTLLSRLEQPLPATGAAPFAEVLTRLTGRGP